MSKAEFKGSIPELLYVVSCDNAWRFFVYEAQALRWFNIKLNENKKPAIYAYSNPKIIGQVK